MRLSGNTRKYFFWALNGLLGVAFILELRAPNHPSWVDAATITLAALASLVALNRQLPFQNILMAALITAAIGGAVHGFSARTAIPLGPIVFNSQSGPQLFNAVPWVILPLWIAALFTARGVARLILRPWRKLKIYGYWLIAVTSLLVLAFDVALEPYAWHVRHLWLWQPTKLLLNWHGASLLNFIGWGFTALLILMFITPSLIRKQPGSSGGVDYHPLIVWLGALLLFAVGCAHAGLWWPVGVDALIAAVSASLAVRGARW